MKLSRLLAQHYKFADFGLAGSFGDGYLMKHNAVYRNIRQGALSLGFRFSPDRNAAYEAFPLLQLELLLADKILPYADNVVAFQSLTPVQLEALTWDDVDGNLKRNFVFHEGVHGIVRSLTNRYWDVMAEGGSIELQRMRAVRMLFEESCANAAELFGCIEAADDIHRIFYEQNSYVWEFAHRTNLKNAMAELGADMMVAFMVLCYLHANFLHKGLDEKSLRQILAVLDATPNDKELKTLRALSKIAFNLSERFRYQTTGFHLRLAGVTTPMEDLFDFDFLSLLEKKLLKSKDANQNVLRLFAELLVRTSST